MISAMRIKFLRRSGFTLIELIVAMAIFLVIIAMAFSTLSSFFAVKTANEQEMILQQNFRTAIDRIKYDFIQASSSPVISSPASNSVSGTLSFTGADNSTISYYLDNSTDKTCTIMRRVGTGTAQPVTEEMHQLVDLYFIRSGGKIVVLIVGDMTYFGKERKISFASLLFSRNANYEKAPTP